MTTQAGVAGAGGVAGAKDQKTLQVNVKVNNQQANKQVAQTGQAVQNVNKQVQAGRTTFLGGSLVGGLFAGTMATIALNSGAAGGAMDQFYAAVARLLNALFQPIGPILDAFFNWFTELPGWIQTIFFMTVIIYAFSGAIGNLVNAIGILIKGLSLFSRWLGFVGLNISLTNASAARLAGGLVQLGSTAIYAAVFLARLFFLLLPGGQAIQSTLGPLGQLRLIFTQLKITGGGFSATLARMWPALGTTSKALGLTTGAFLGVVAAVSLLVLLLFDLAFGWGLFEGILSRTIPYWTELKDIFKQIWDIIFPWVFFIPVIGVAFLVLWVIIKYGTRVIRHMWFWFVRTIKTVGGVIKRFLQWIGVWDHLISFTIHFTNGLVNLWNILLDFLAWFDQNFEAIFENAFIAVGKGIVQFVNLIISGINLLLEGLYAIYNLYNKLAGNPLKTPPVFDLMKEPEYRELGPWITDPNFQRDFTTYWEHPDRDVGPTTINFNGNVYGTDELEDLIVRLMNDPNTLSRTDGGT